MVSALSSGMPLHRALEEGAKGAPEPVASELARLAEDLKARVPEKDAFRSLAERYPCPETRDLADAVELYVEVGGPRALDLVRATLERLRESMNVRFQVEQQVKHLRLNAAAVVLVPPLAVAAIASLAPELVSALWTTQAGRFCALVAAVSVAGGIAWMWQILKSVEEF
ncbi:type II secretion system F family protein [Ammonifex thiophilus]|nr:type II secretion system F family protein [Ammonifex thiophilus]